MAASKRDDLELDDDRRFQEKFWTFERFAWVLLGLIVLAALAGFTGQGGPFGRAKAAGSSGEIDYPRVTRWETSDEIRLTLAGGGDQAVVEIGSAFSEVFEFEDMQPAPSASYATPEGHRHVFDLRGGSGKREIVMHVRAMRPALGVAIDMRINDAPALQIRPVVLP